MAYLPSIFTDGGAVPVSAHELNRLGTGLAAAQAMAEDAAAVAGQVQGSAAAVVAGLALRARAVRTTDSAAVTATTATPDGQLHVSLSGVAGKRVEVCLYLVFQGDSAASPTVRLGLSAVNSALNIRGTLNLLSCNTAGAGQAWATTALDRTGQGIVTAAVPTGTTTGVTLQDVHFAYGFASLAVGTGTDPAVITVLTSQGTGAGTGIVLVAGSCITTEVLQ